MKVWKLVSGILSIILFVLVTFQSCAAGIANTLENNGEVSGSAGVMVAVFMLAGGIVSIATRNAKKNGGNIALIVLFGLAALVGFANYGSYSDLAIWSGWCFINAVLAVVAMFTGKNKGNDNTTVSDNQ
jgi:Ca2+/Na+ antiporter